MLPAAALRGVSFAYADGTPVLDDFTFAVPAGEFCAIVGPNGSGKSTVVRLLLGLEAPSAGAAELFGIPVARFRAWGRIGYVPQRQTFDPTLPATVEEVVQSGLMAGRGLLARRRPPSGREGRDADREAVALALAEVGIAGLARRHAARLSGGQVQRVMLARALVGQPELLVLDEPTAAVDAASRRQFMQTVTALHTDAARTILMISHALPEIEQHVDRIVSMDSGRVVGDSLTEMAHVLPGEAEGAGDARA